MSPRLLLDLSDLFSIEALAADLDGDADEADRLWDIADALHKRFLDGNDFEPPTRRDVRTT